MNGRMYDPVLARFLSPDSIMQAPDNTQNLNRYSYALNNPLKYTDPTGYYIDEEMRDFYQWEREFEFNAITNSFHQGEFNGDANEVQTEGNIGMAEWYTNWSENDDEWEVNIETQEVKNVGTDGGAKEQHITYVDKKGKRLPIAMQVLKGHGFNLDKNGLSTNVTDYGSPFFEFISKSAIIPFTGGFEKKSPGIRLTFQTELGPSIGTKLKVGGFGPKFKFGLTKSVTAAVFTEDMIDTHTGGKWNSNLEFGLGPFSIGANSELNSNTVYLQGNFGIFEYNESNTKNDRLRVTLFEIGENLFIGGASIKITGNSSFFSRDSRK